MCCKHFHTENWSAPQRNFAPLRRWQLKAQVSRRSPARLGCLGERQSGACTTCARTARWCRATLEDHVVRRLVCVVCVFFQLGPLLQDTHFLTFRDVSLVNCMVFNVFSVSMIDCLLETTSGQADASKIICQDDIVTAPYARNLFSISISLSREAKSLAHHK